MAAKLSSLRQFSRRKLLALCVIGCTLAAVSYLNAGSGNLGKALGQAGGGTVTLTQSSVFTVTTTPGQAMTGPGSVLTSFVAKINLDPNFQAAVITDPNDPTAASFSFLRTGGAEVSHMQLCETDPNIDNLGLVFMGGADPLIWNKVTAVNADGNYRFTIDLWDSADFDQTFNTTLSPNNTAAGLNGSISSALILAGYTVIDNGSSFNIHKPADKIMAVRVSSTDTGVVNTCLDLTPVPPMTGGGIIPTLPEYGLAILSLLLLASAIIVVKRRKRSAH